VLWLDWWSVHFRWLYVSPRLSIFDLIFTNPWCIKALIGHESKSAIAWICKD
jgi:hypothetical protein